ncbi:MAG: hypothetical protein KDB23_31970, partial [Planctomycetales bacterium]|nr:hypothetical protein [Planctomycetales bacterium]
PPGTGEISGRFFHDANGDGVQSAGEPGIDGVTMRLMTEGVSLVTETTSVDLNADGTIDPLTEQGIYAFSSLPARNYTVQVDGTAWVTTLPSIGSYTFDLADGATLGDNLFGATYDGPLQPGDANQDYFVDATDLIQAFKLTSGLNSPADWASGDWNGAPGGKVGAPPFGNGFFNADDLTLAFPFYNQAGSYAPVAGTPVNTLQPLVNRSDTDVALVYDAATGGALLYGASQWNLSIVQLHSDQGWFRDVERDPVFGAAFSSESANELVAFSGFNGGLLLNHELSLGATFAPGLTLAEIAAEVTIDGARMGGGSIGEVGVMSLAEYESQFGSLQGRVYADLNRNGQLDDGETSQATTPLIVLYDLASGERVRDVYPSPHDLNGNGAIDADENNAYVFERLPESRYRIEVETGDSYGLVTQLPESIEVFAGNITTGVDIGVLTRPRFDFNEDFVLDEADIALMCRAMNDVTFAERKFDL